MESKRKAVAASPESPGADERAAKRRKIPEIDLSNGETPESTTEYGFSFFELARTTKDKRGRLAATSFLTLPSKKEFPDYYKVTPMPLAFDTIEAKLARRAYPTLTTLESDVKRLVANAKSYNEKNSEVYADAERIRKVLSNFMTKHNPAYKDPSYAAFPTPLPEVDAPAEEEADAEGEEDAEGEVDGVGEADGGAEGDGDGGDAEAEEEEEAPKVTVKKRAKGRGKARRRASAGKRGASASKQKQPEKEPSEAPPTPEPEQEDGPKIPEGQATDLTGLTFQKAQEQILIDLMHLKDEEGVEISTPFLQLPSRKLTDYYHMIKKPTSLKGTEKKVRGVHGRNDPTGITDFKSWDAYEDEVSFVWRNAKEYNEDGSEIWLLADQLEKFFKSRMADARSLVQEPAQARLKLKMSTAKTPEAAPQKIMLRVGGQKATSPVAAAPTSTQEPTRDSVDKDRANVVATNGVGEAGTNGVSRRPGTSSGNHQAEARPAPAPVTAPKQQDAVRSSSRSVASPTPSGVVKNEDSFGKSPSLGSVKPVSNSIAGVPTSAAPTMAPPVGVVDRTTSDSPHLASSMVAPQQQAAAPAYAPATGIYSKWRQSGKDASDALISNLSIFPHQALKATRPFHLDIAPSNAYSQQSFAMHVPAEQYLLHVVPTVASVVEGRQSKLIVTAHTSAGMQRLTAAPQIPNKSDPQKPVYEVRLVPGANRIEVEMIAGPMRGAPKVGAGQELELEKITVYLNLLKPQ